MRRDGIEIPCHFLNRNNEPVHNSDSQRVNQEPRRIVQINGSVRISTIPDILSVLSGHCPVVKYNDDTEALSA